jgi:anti-sigma factor RsiW
MNCERVAELLPDYFAGALNHDLDDQLEDHLQQCAQCRESVTLWNELARLPQEQPSPALRARFEAMLRAYQEGQSERAKGSSGPQKVRNVLPFRAEGNWLRPAGVFACALVLLAVGFAGGRYMGASNTHSQEQLIAMQKEMSGVRQLLVLSMLQQQSASERLQGITWSTQAQSDPKVLAALLHTLRYDSSVDVRLAALNALSRHGDQPMVRAGLLDTLQARQSPLVQVALIDQLVEMRYASALQQLRKVQQDPDTNPVVRQRAEWAIQKLD